MSAFFFLRSDLPRSTVVSNLRNNSRSPFSDQIWCTLHLRSLLRNRSSWKRRRPRRGCRSSHLEDIVLSLRLWPAYTTHHTSRMARHRIYLDVSHLCFLSLGVYVSLSWLSSLFLFLLCPIGCKLGGTFSPNTIDDVLQFLIIDPCQLWLLFSICISLDSMSLLVLMFSISNILFPS